MNKNTTCRHTEAIIGRNLPERTSATGSAMNSPSTPPIWRHLPTKPQAYEALYWLNRSFEATLLSLERLEQLGMFRLEYLNEYKIQIEHTRALVNEELLDTLGQYEMTDCARFEGMHQYWQNLRKDPDDVFFHAHDRKQAIREEMKELQSGLKRQRPPRRTKKKKL